jgi:F-type H+-transporting ATPase subunit b
MQLDWTTFILEVLNFLVLVWILKHFLYKPVLAVLDARQQRIRDEMAKAAALQEDAGKLQQQYEARLADWNAEREQARQKLAQELAQERANGMKAIQQSLADEEAKARVRDAAAIASREAELVRQASGAAYSNAAIMLRRMASPALTQSIVNILLEDLASLPQAERDVLQKAAQAPGVSQAEIAAAHALDDKTLATIAAALSQAAGKPLQYAYKQNADLIAGLRISVGENVLHANLADELGFFKRRAKHD